VRWVLSLLLVSQQPVSTILCTVTSNGVPVPSADVVVAGRTYVTGPDGGVRIPVQPGEIAIVVAKEGFGPVTTSVTVAPRTEQAVVVELQPQPTLEEHVTVSATRTDKRIEDQPMRVEVLDRDEIEEKIMMTPGDIVMMLNEMGGLRVQATSPSIGAASVRIQGMRGRYTRFLSDGLPLFGQEVGGLGLLQIPPTDLARVEVIKGVASALYGAGALGGVVNLIARRPDAQPAGEILVNRSTAGATDTVLFAARPLSERWKGTLLIGGHWQEQNDIDGDAWADLAGYSRGIARPRVFWDDQHGRSIFATAGVMWERRHGGTMPGAILQAAGAPFVEALETTRIDGGLVAQTLIRGHVLTARASASRQDQDHRFGEGAERDLHDTLFGEVALRGTAVRQTWVVGAAFERDVFQPDNLPRFAYRHNVPAVFAQDDIDLRKWLSVSASGRLDDHSQFGAFFSPRVSALFRSGQRWTSRVSVGTGFFAPTPLTEETEAAGLARLAIPFPLKTEHGRSTSFDLTRSNGPLTVTTTLFNSEIRDPVILDREIYALENLSRATVNTGLELVATIRYQPFSLTATYAYVRSREGVGPSRSDVPLTPRHSAGVVGMWEKEDRGRVGLEAYFTGRQRLEDNPYRAESVPYILFGGLAERRVGRLRIFINIENAADVRQTSWNPLLRPQRAADGRWTVDAWAPVDGRVINGGVRVGF
jgi:iron complex outermembrane receptor protein